MYLVDVKAVDRDSGAEDAVTFAWDNNGVYGEHEDCHMSSAGFASSL